MFINHLLTIAKTIFGKKNPRDSISNCFIVLSVHYRKIVKKTIEHKYMCILHPISEKVKSLSLYIVM